MASECSVTLVVDGSRASYAEKGNESFPRSSTLVSDTSYVHIGDVVAAKLLVSPMKSGMGGEKLLELCRKFSKTSISLEAADGLQNDPHATASDAEIIHCGEWSLIQREAGVNAPPQVHRFISFRCGGRYGRALKKTLTISVEDVASMQSAADVASILKSTRLLPRQPRRVSLSASRDVILMSSLSVSVQSKTVNGSVLVNVSVENTRVSLPVVIWHPVLHLATSTIPGVDQSKMILGSQLDMLYKAVCLSDSLEPNQGDQDASEYSLSKRFENLSTSRPWVLKPKEVFRFGFSISVDLNQRNKTASEAAVRDAEIDTPVAIPLASFPLGETTFPETFMAATVLISNFRWTPPTASGEITVKFTGPNVVQPRVPFTIQMILENRTSHDIQSAQLRLQTTTASSSSGMKASTFRNHIVPLRTGIAMGQLTSFSSAHLTLDCVALDRGIAQLGQIEVHDATNPGKRWISTATYEVFVADASDLKEEGTRSNHNSTPLTTPTPTSTIDLPTA